MSDRDTAVHCPECGSDSVRRSRRAGVAESLRMMAGNYPFRCTNCGNRFWSNVWLFSSMRWAKCPRCLNMKLSDWPLRHYHVTGWSQFLTAIGGKPHRCSRCRYNFISFRSRLPQYQTNQPALDEYEEVPQLKPEKKPSENTPASS